LKKMLRRHNLVVVALLVCAIAVAAAPANEKAPSSAAPANEKADAAAVKEFGTSHSGAAAGSTHAASTKTTSGTERKLGEGAPAASLFSSAVLAKKGVFSGQAAFSAATAAVC
jgi:hypothetical protein